MTRRYPFKPDGWPEHLGAVPHYLSAEELERRRREPMRWHLDPSSPAAHALRGLREELWVKKLNKEGDDG